MADEVSTLKFTAYNPAVCFIGWAGKSCNKADENNQNKNVEIWLKYTFKCFFTIARLLINNAFLLD